MNEEKKPRRVAFKKKEKKERKKEKEVFKKSKHNKINIARLFYCLHNQEARTHLSRQVMVFL